jgi:hypothetical protein
MWQTILLALLGRVLTPAMIQKLLLYVVGLVKVVAARTANPLDDKAVAMFEDLVKDPNVLAHLTDYLSALIRGKPTPPVIDPLNPPVIPVVDPVV